MKSRNPNPQIIYWITTISFLTAIVEFGRGNLVAALSLSGIGVVACPILETPQIAIVLSLIIGTLGIACKQSLTISF